MRYPALILAAFCFLGFGTRATAVTEMFRVWQEFSIASEANGYDSQGVQIPDFKYANFAATMFGYQGEGLSSTAPNCSADAHIQVWGWRTNISGDTFNFDGNIGGAAALIAGTGASGVALYAGSNLGYRQIYEFSVSTMPGATETVTIDVSQLAGDAALYASLTMFRPTSSTVPAGNFSTVGRVETVLSDGDYRLVIQLSVVSPPPTVGGPATGFVGSWNNSVRFSNLTPFPGWYHNYPIIKDPVSCRYCYDFQNISKATWVGSPAASEFSFQMIGNSMFTGIVGFPPGFTNQIEVVAGSSSLGFFSTNQPVDFVRLAGSAIPSFKVRNIAPLVEGGLTNTFSLALNYDTDTADFVMIPNPGLTIFSQTNGQARLFFAGALEQSTNLVNWVDVPGSPSSPYVVTPTTSPVPLFFRARQQ